jgi:iron complex outermembrane receptor protein
LTAVQDGREVHKGIEFTATGKVTERLTLFGGLTLMDCKIVREADDPAIDGNRPESVSNQMAKVYAEYDLPWVSGLTLTGGVYYTGNFYADPENTDRLPGVITGDVGARYTTKIHETPLIFRLNVTNVTNKSYWLSQYYVGDPRSIAFSVQAKF